MSQAILYSEPLEGLPKPAFRIRMSGRLEPERITATFLDAARRTGTGSLYLLVDRRGMEPFANARWYIAFFRQLHEAGVTRYRSVVLDTDVLRPHMGALVQEAAIAAGLDAAIRHAWTGEEALRHLREMMAAGA